MIDQVESCFGIWMRLDMGWLQRIEIDQRKPLWENSYGDGELDFHKGD